MTDLENYNEKHRNFKTEFLYAFKTLHFSNVTASHDNECKYFYDVDFAWVFKTQHFQGVISGTDKDRQCFHIAKTLNSYKTDKT